MPFLEWVKMLEKPREGVMVRKTVPNASKSGVKWTDYERLELFASQAYEFEQMKFLANKPDFGVNVSIDCFGIRSIDEYGIDEEQLRAFLTKLRPFLSVKEPVHLQSIYEIASRLVRHEDAKSYILKSRRQWKEERKRPLIRFIFDRRQIKNEDIVDWWINGIYFHHDKEKKTQIARMPKAVRAISKYDFICSILEAAGHVLWVGRNLRYALKNGFVERAETSASGLITSA
jgi:hypothetical protein